MRLFITAIIAGELFSLFFDVRHPPWGLISIFTGSAILYLSYLVYQKQLFQQLPIWFITLAIFFLIGFYWTQYLKHHKDTNQLQEQFDESTVKIIGYIDGLPKVSPKGVQFTFMVERYTFIRPQKGDDAQMPKRVWLFYSSPNQQIMPGQRWQFTVKLKKPHGLKNPYSFDVEQWMYINDIGAQGNIQSQQAQGAQFISPWVWSLQTVIERARFLLRQKIEESVGAQSKYVGVITALVIGDQQLIQPDDWKMFSATGIGHLISISGLHVTMLAGFGASLTRLLWKRTRWIYWMPSPLAASTIGLITALIYSCLAGFQIPAQRTTYMVGANTLALWFGRVIHPFDGWFWALLIILLINPWAIYSPGFWLSFGAVAAILFAMSKDPSGVHDVDLLFLQKLRSSLGEATRVQAVVTIALIPLTLYWFYQISFISPLANAIAIPIVSFLVTPCAILGAFLPSYLGDLFLYIAHGFFQGLAYLIEPMSRVEWAVIHGAQPSPLHLWLALIGVLCCIRPGIIAHTWKSRFIGLVLCISLFIPFYYIPGKAIDAGEFEMFVWDIGQGNAVLIQTKSHQLLFDTGPMSFGKFDPAEKIIIPHLRAKGIRSIDQLLISHQDSDHIGGLPFLLENFSINNISGSIPPQHPLQKLFVKHQVPFEYCQAGQRWQWDGVEFLIWHPTLEESLTRQFELTKPNEMSCVLEVRNEHHSVWLTGDVEKHGELSIIQQLHHSPMEHQEVLERHLVLMAPHHGSKSSSSNGFIEVLNPDLAFSQTGYRNRYLHPHREVVGRYQNKKILFLDTVITGAQSWRTQGAVIDVKTWR